MMRTVLQTAAIGVVGLGLGFGLVGMIGCTDSTSTSANKLGTKMDDKMGGKMDDKMGGKMDDKMGGKMDDKMGGKMDDKMGGKMQTDKK